jgi:Rho-binding antiterminator
MEIFLPTGVTMYKPISCHLHDYLEIACMKHLQIAIQTKDKKTIEAEAITTHTRPDKTEWLEYKQEGNIGFIRLDEINAITALDKNAPFATIQF